MNLNKSCVVLGVGPSTGNSVALRFAKAGYKVALAARNQKNMNPTAEFISKRGGDVLSIPTDSSNEDSVKELIKRSVSELGTLEVAIYNASSFIMKSVLELTASDVESAWKTACLGGFFFAREAAKEMIKTKSGTIIFTGATGGIRGSKNFAGFAIGKFGLRALAQSMARELQPEGIHVIWVNIDGQIENPKNNTLSYLQNDTKLDPESIAETYFQLHKQHRSAWTHEIDLRPWKETF